MGRSFYIYVPKKKKSKIKFVLFKYISYISISFLKKKNNKQPIRYKLSFNQICFSYIMYNIQGVSLKFPQPSWDNTVSRESKKKMAFINMSDGSMYFPD